jgi:hypothetical protein
LPELHRQSVSQSVVLAKCRKRMSRDDACISALDLRALPNSRRQTSPNQLYTSYLPIAMFNLRCSMEGRFSTPQSIEIKCYGYVPNTINHCGIRCSTGATLLHTHHWYLATTRGAPAAERHRCLRSRSRRGCPGTCNALAAPCDRHSHEARSDTLASKRDTGIESKH